MDKIQIILIWKKGPTENEKKDLTDMC